MKTLVLTALMGVTLSAANANVNPASLEAPVRITAEAPAAIDRQTQAFIDQIEMHQWHVNTVWQQYDRSVSAIKSKRGSVQDLQSQMNALIKFYQDDIAQGVRLQDSRNAIDEIYAMYNKKINKQAKAEAKQISRLQALLGIELNREESEFQELIETNAHLINSHSEPVIRAMEREFAHADVNFKALQRAGTLASR